MPTDFYNIDSFYSDEERLTREAARKFAENEIKPIIEKHYHAGTFPIDLAKKMGALGLFGIVIPQEYGGAGLNYTCYGLAMQEIERGDSGIRSFASVQNSLVMFPIFAFGSEEMKQKWLSKLASGEAIGCFGLTEPNFGSNPAGMITKAEKTDGGYLLSGEKMWITSGSIADIAIAWAKLDGKVRGFIVEKGMKGFSTYDIEEKYSLRATVTSGLVLDNVEVPRENMLKVSGMKGPLSCLTKARFGIAWGAAGAALEVYEMAVDYAKKRIQFDKALGSFQITQVKLADMLAEITQAQLLNYRLGRLMDEGTATPQQVSMAKRINAKMALECAKLSREIHGANGILSRYPVMRHMANLETVNTYEGTYDIHSLILGQEITGISAF